MYISEQLLDDAETELGISPEEIKEVQRRNKASTGPALDGLEHADLRYAMIARTSIDVAEDAHERYIDGNQLLPINYMALGLAKAESVGLVSYFDNVDRQPFKATGFLVSPRLLMTNRHVFPVDTALDFKNRFDDSTVQFGYQLGLDGRPGPTVTFDLDPDAFFYARKDLDLALVAVRETDRTGRANLRSQGYLVLNGAIGKAGEGDFATVIQHAEGKLKQVSLRGNEIINYGQHQTQLFYKSDTELGSSGSPVFNDEWQLIALHSAGVGKKNANNQYVDSNNQVIPVVKGKVDATRIVWECNRGYRISAIMNHLDSPDNPTRLAPHVQDLFAPSYSDARAVSRLSMPTAEERAPNSPPLSVVSAEPRLAPLSIHISIGGGQAEKASTLTAATATTGVDHADIEAERKLEDEMDFTDCEGYRDDFMGERIPLPTPDDDLKALLARRNDRPNAYVLQYHHFSTMHHSVRRVPVLSAMNVLSKQRYDELDKRNDRWIRDNRIDYEVQLDDAWYKYSGFDRGHLSRREDAEWGPTMEFAKKAADLTCSYANAVPQAPGFNRGKYGYHGKWGRLEQELLEKGVRLESGKSGRICVFSGPIFKSNDRPFRGVQVALSFYKVVVWYDADGQLRTTCYVLNQRGQVSDIEFEMLRFDEIFEAEQKSLAFVQRETGLRFAQVMHDSDTSPDGVIGNAVDLPRLRGGGVG